jgi:hypothetical protein
MGSIRWTAWRLLDACRDGKLIPPGPGAYRIRCRRSTVGRVVGRDREPPGGLPRRPGRFRLARGGMPPS